MRPSAVLSLTLPLLFALGVLNACGGGSSDAPAPTPAPAMSLEPAATSIGVAQTIDLFVAYKERDTDAYPLYVDPLQVQWTSSRPDIASVASNGQVTGLSEGSTTITAQYQSLQRQVAISVGGSFMNFTFVLAGQGARSYAVLMPSGVANGVALPVLLAAHGGGGTARINASSSLLSALGQQREVLVVYPEGTGVIQTFNAGACCGGARTANVDDVAYFRALLDDVAARFSIDSARVYATGFSNGGMISHRLACEMADRIAGIAAVGGASGQFDRSLNSYYSCNPSRPIPILHVHATNDRNYPYAGGYGLGLSDTDFYPVDATIADWISRNNVQPQGVSQDVTATTRCTRYDLPANSALPSAPVALCKIDPPDVFDAVTGIVYGGGHSWPGGNRSLAPGSDAPVADFRVNDYLWSFFGN